MPHNTPRLIAAVDLGSSSFRMMIGRVEELHGQAHVYALDSLRDPVRLGAGLGEDKRLDAASQERALAALERFGERLRSFAPDNVRAVATNAVRVARNAKEFLKKAEAALGFPIEVIAGQEEARLIYVGVAHLLPMGQGQRLVVDIGGGSTEFIIGLDSEPLELESLYVGCVSSSEKYFPEGVVSSKAMKEAILAARKEMEVLRRGIAKRGWTHAVGSSGTARALSELLSQNGWASVGQITREGLETLKRHVIESGSVYQLPLQGIKQDRLPVLAGGLAVMSAVFEELDLHEMMVTEGALRQGVIYDLLGRSLKHDMRAITVEQFMRRYGIDRSHAHTVASLASDFLVQIAASEIEHDDGLIQTLQWACSLHEAGLTIAHNGYHKHGCYILQNADMPGFSKPEQELLSLLVLGHTGKLGKLAEYIAEPLTWKLIFSIRLAVLFLRRRTSEHLPAIGLKFTDRKIEFQIDPDWLESHPLTAYSLEQEAAEWRRLGWKVT